MVVTYHLCSLCSITVSRRILFFAGCLFVTPTASFDFVLRLAQNRGSLRTALKMTRSLFVFGSIGGRLRSECELSLFWSCRMIPIFHHSNIPAPTHSPICLLQSTDSKLQSSNSKLSLQKPSHPQTSSRGDVRVMPVRHRMAQVAAENEAGALHHSTR